MSWSIQPCWSRGACENNARGAPGALVWEVRNQDEGFVVVIEDSLLTTGPWRCYAPTADSPMKMGSLTGPYDTPISLNCLVAIWRSQSTANNSPIQSLPFNPPSFAVESPNIPSKRCSRVVIRQKRLSHLAEHVLPKGSSWNRVVVPVYIPLICSSGMSS